MIKKSDNMDELYKWNTASLPKWGNHDVLSSWRHFEVSGASMAPTMTHTMVLNDN